MKYLIKDFEGYRAGEIVSDSFEGETAKIEAGMHTCAHGRIREVGLEQLHTDNWHKYYEVMIRVPESVCYFHPESGEIYHYTSMPNMDDFRPMLVGMEFIYEGATHQYANLDRGTIIDIQGNRYDAISCLVTGITGVCKECNGTRFYIGLNVKEPCSLCGISQ
jgi:predicted nucleic-acid-binding Zn-ribbon protein